MDQGPGGSGKPPRRRAKAPANAFWRENTLWGRITIKNREIRWSLRTSDAAVARRRIDERRKKEIAQTHFGEIRRTYREVVTSWGSHIAKKVGPETSKRYAVSLGQLEPWLLELFFDEIDRDKIKEIADARLKVVAVATLRRDLTALSSVFEYAIGEDWADKNPALQRLKMLTERRDPIILPEPKHIEAVISRVGRASVVFASLCRVALLTGARQNELVYARRSRLDHHRRQLVIVGKGNKLRTIDLSPAAYAEIKTIPIHIGSDFIFHHDGKPFKNVSSRFAGFVRTERNEAVKAVQNSAHWPKADFREFRFHDLRHRYAVDHLKNGGNIYFLQKHLGHRSIKTTELYLEYLTPEEAQRAKFTPAQDPAQGERFGAA